MEIKLLKEVLKMAEKKDIICPCGNHLGTATHSAGGSKVCSRCKKRVKYKVTASGVQTAYEK